MTKLQLPFYRDLITVCGVFYEMSKQIKILGKGSYEPLADENFLRLFVLELIDLIGMQPLGDALLVNVPLEINKLGREPFEDEGGISCLSCLSTSHISIHTWPLRKEFHLDIYSCREFDQNIVCTYIIEKMSSSMIQMKDLSYACEWHNDIPKSTYRHSICL